MLKFHTNIGKFWWWVVQGDSLIHCWFVLLELVK